MHARLRALARGYPLDLQLLGVVGRSSTARLLPSPKTHLCIGAFPRVGYTFVVVLAEAAYSDLTISHQLAFPCRSAVTPQTRRAVHRSSAGA